MTGNLVLILGDQLTAHISSLRQADKKHDRIVMAEVAEEATYVGHHKKKIIFIFAAMRRFAAMLRAQGWQVDYVTLDDPLNEGSLLSEVRRFAQTYQPNRIIITEPGEWRLLDAMASWEQQLPCPIQLIEDERFICSRDEFLNWADGRKQLRQEFFYREMRRKTGLLMDGDKPVGGKWNYDADNRKPAKPDLMMTGPLKFDPDADTLQVIELVKERFADNFGDAEPFWFGVTQDQAEAAFEHFLSHSLALFGDYQDAMLIDHPFLYHAVISIYLNVGLLDPLTVCHRVEEAYRAGDVPLNAAEGFIRQIIGWREYVRGIYWMHMPDYGTRNSLDAKRSLPTFYWTAETDLNCLRQAIGQTKSEAYAHHIQRLMVTGNFALLAGIDPVQIHEWYLAVYADAFEWVEMPNTLGMSQFADGGLLGSKPYAASGNYINRMSDYCSGCRYDVKKKTGDDACPFNALYWDFLHRNATALKSNPRLANIYRTWDKMGAEKQQTYLDSAANFLATL